MKKIELNKNYYLDLGSLSGVEVKTLNFTNEGVLCEYVRSWPNRIEVLSYDVFEINGYSK